MSMPTESLSYQTQTMEDALVELTLESFDTSGSYRPDRTSEEIMKYIQAELGARGIQTTLMPIWEYGGGKEPVTYRISPAELKEVELAPVIQLEDYRAA